MYWYNLAKSRGYKEAEYEIQKLKYGGRVCGTLHMVMALPTAIPQKDCVYINDINYITLILQSTSGGFLVNTRPEVGITKSIYVYRTINMGNDLVDGASIPAGHYKYMGVFSYMSLMGERSVYSFKFVE